MTFGVLVFDQVAELDFVGPWEMLGMWSKFADGPKHCVIVAESRAPVVGAHGLSINPQHAFGDCPPLDYLLVPGGPGTRQQVNNRALVDFVARQAGGCRATLSVCTGAFVLHAAGLLSGRRATTHWASLQRLRELGGVTVLEQRFVHDGTLWTSAGVSAGIDMMLAFIAQVAGDGAAAKVQLSAEYYPAAGLYGGPERHVQAPAYVERKAS